LYFCHDLTSNYNIPLFGHLHNSPPKKTKTTIDHNKKVKYHSKIGKEQYIMKKTIAAFFVFASLAAGAFGQTGNDQKKVTVTPLGG
jgi:hypothetical protein